MNNYFSEFSIIDDKLVEVLEANQLIRKFNTDKYPITMTISPNVSLDAQMTMHSIAEDGVSSEDAKLVFTFPVGEIGIRMVGRLIISDALMSKIKSFAKKMHYLYLQGMFAKLSEDATVPKVQAPVVAKVADGPEPADFAEFFDEDTASDVDG